jgi:hypothetical protein
MDKGKYVSRSTYQKVVEENKRLKADLKDLTTQHYSDERWLEAYTRWWRHFKKERDFQDTLRVLFDPTHPLHLDNQTNDSLTPNDPS